MKHLLFLIIAFFSFSVSAKISGAKICNDIDAKLTDATYVGVLLEAGETEAFVFDYNFSKTGPYTFDLDIYPRNSTDLLMKKSIRFLVSSDGNCYMHDSQTEEKNQMKVLDFIVRPMGISINLSNQEGYTLILRGPEPI